MDKKRSLLATIVLPILMLALCGTALAGQSHLIWSTYLGGSSNQEGIRDIAVDDTGAVYVTGFTRSEDFPVSPGVFDETHNGSFDIFVAKLSPDGTALDFCLFLGGEGKDQPYGIVVDETGAVYIAGRTDSPDFPTTPGAFDRTYNGGWNDVTRYDAFVAKISPDGSALVYSTYLGGANYDGPGGLVVDDAGCVYVAGRSDSWNFPTTAGAFDTTYNEGVGTADVFVTKLSADGASSLYSTFIGGTLSDSADGIAIDALGNAYVCGGTGSEDFPTTANAFTPIFNEPWDNPNRPPRISADAFVAKVNPEGSGLVYATYLGGERGEGASGIVVDASGCAYVAGGTWSADFPVTPGAFDTTLDCLGSA